MMTLFLIKVTVLLGSALLLAGLMARRNPRWRMLIGELAVGGVLLLPLVSLLPDAVSLSLPIPVLIAAPGESRVPDVQALEAKVAPIERAALPHERRPVEEAAVGLSGSRLSVAKPSEALRNSFPMLLAAVYLVGVSFLVVRRIAVGRRLRGVLKKLEAPEVATVRVLEEVSEEMGSVAPRLLVSDACIAPLALGMRRGTVVIPKSLMAPGQSSALRMALRHEVHHLANRDLHRLFVLQLFAMALWFHPLAWLLRRSHLLAMEELSDRVAAGPGGTARYTATLAKMALALTPQRSIAGAAAGWISTPQIVGRLRRLKHPVPYGPVGAGRMVAGVGCGLALSVVLAALGWAHPKHRAEGGKGALFGVNLPKELQAQARQTSKSVLDYLLTQQRDDGSFAMAQEGGGSQQCGLTAMAGMAFYAHGGTDPQSPYHKPMRRCLNYVKGRQDEAGYFHENAKSKGNMYHHSLSTWFIATAGEKVEGGQAWVRESVSRAIKIILEAQAVPKADAHQGGWRYTPESKDSDLSVTACAMRALLAAKDLGAQVPGDAIHAGLAYVQRNQLPDGGFSYVHGGGASGVPRTGMALFVMHRTGQGESPIAKSAARYILMHVAKGDKGHFHYGLSWCASAMAERGGKDARKFADWMIPYTANTLQRDGSFAGPSGSLVSSLSVALALAPNAGTDNVLPGAGPQTENADESEAIDELVK